MRFALLMIAIAVLAVDSRADDAAQGHWAFDPLTTIAVPAVTGNERLTNPVDAFIHSSLQHAGLTFAPEADRATLLRRVTFDLTGLPPTPERVEAFLNDDRPDAYLREVERLLASPRYGERWAQHWLDAARFAESDGFEFDHERPNAWRYRDWVVRSLNADISFSDFVRSQLAGDEMHPPAPDATGFLMTGPDMVDINLAEERRHNFLNDMTATTGAVFLGLSVGCAQCHDHKSDPVSIHEFYSLRAFFDNTVVNPKKSKQLAAAVKEPGTQVAASYVRERGDFRHQGDQVQPAFPSVLNTHHAQVSPPRPDSPSSMRRSALADWMTHAGNPLAFRVMANRIWLHHFGRGLVVTPNDFGKLGDRPSHPQLLDWLASELAHDSIGFKSLHRTLVTSTTYRQTSLGTTASDPDNRLLSRMPRRRLSGEAMRDSILYAADSLNLKTGGLGVRPPLPEEVRSTLLKDQWNVTADRHEHSRRSLYLFVRRNLRFPLFEVFDRPDTNESCGRRLISTTAPQALTLFNSEFTRLYAEQLAAIVLARSPEPVSFLTDLYLRVLSRYPRSDELDLASQFLTSQSAVSDPRTALADFCLALLNSNEAIYID